MKYYVYELVNSLDGKTFYVGKGKKQRMHVHENRARRDHTEKGENPKLRNKILSIWKNGGTIFHKQIFFTDNDIEAYDKEVERIKELGLENLCNLRLHQMTPEEAYQRRALQMLGTHPSEETKNNISNTLMGHPVKLSTRRKISVIHKGKSRPCTESKRISIANARRPSGGFPEVLSPTGEKYKINVLTDFCKVHSLHLPSMSYLLRRKRFSHRGWILA